MGRIDPQMRVNGPWVRSWQMSTWYYYVILIVIIFIFQSCMIIWATLVAQTVKNLPVRQDTQLRSLGQEDPLEKGMATHSSNLAWRIPWTELPGGLQYMGSQRVGHHWATNTFTFIIIWLGWIGVWMWKKAGHYFKSISPSWVQTGP